MSMELAAGLEPLIRVAHHHLPNLDCSGLRIPMKLYLKTAFLIATAMLFVFAAVEANANAQDLFLKDQIDDFGNIPVDDPVTMSSEFKIITGKRTGMLEVTAEIVPNWHVFSMKDTNGPIPSKISVAESKDYKLTGKFKPDHKPHLKDEAGFDEPCEEFEGIVTWSAPIELADGVEAKDLVINMVFNGQTCQTNGGCIQLSFDVASKFGGFDDKLAIRKDFVQTAVKIEEFQPDGLHAAIKARFVRAAGTDEPISPGDTVKLEITATPDTSDDWHIYSYSLKETQYMSTIVGFTETNGWTVKGPAVSEEPEEGEAFGVPAFYHHYPVTWTFNVTIPDSAENNKTYVFKGAMGFQTCTNTGCDAPAGVTFEASIPVGTTSIVPVTWKNGSYEDAKKATKAEPLDTVSKTKNAPDGPVDDAPEKPQADKAHAPVFVEDTPEEIAAMAKLYDPEKKIKYLISTEMKDNPVGSGGTSSANQTTLWTAIFGAFVGGMILNLMPCVFPVLGLKVMGFVMQAGSDPAKIRKHGIAFAFGLVVSMWILGGIILIIKQAFGRDINWGAQMGNPYFVVAIIVLLFLLGLNMAGVFEIGTSLSSVGGKAQQKKGYLGSFLSGVLTTLIATPCSGPFLGVAMSYTMAQEAHIAMFLFTIFALGIAAPYLVLSFFPVLINQLPKPGPWMETFRVTMAFALFATVAFFMQAFGGQTGVGGLSWLAMALVVIGLAAYFYGNWSEPSVKPFKRWAFGHVMPALIAVGGIWMCYDAANQESEVVASHNIGGLAWQRWNPGKIEYSLAKKKKIIWVDYTADW